MQLQAISFGRKRVDLRFWPPSGNGILFPWKGTFSGLLKTFLLQNILSEVTSGPAFCWSIAMAAIQVSASSLAPIEAHSGYSLAVTHWGDIAPSNWSVRLPWAAFTALEAATWADCGAAKQVEETKRRENINNILAVRSHARLFNVTMVRRNKAQVRGRYFSPLPWLSSRSRKKARETLGPRCLFN